MHTVHEWKRLPNYGGLEWHGWFSVGFGRSRDSDVLEESNFQSALALLEPLSTDLDETRENCGQSVTVVTENHWAVGWVEWIAIHASNTVALDKARELCDRANNYPILNETHYSNLEYERAMEFWDSMSLKSKVGFCKDCDVSIFAARRSHDLPDRLWAKLTA